MQSRNLCVKCQRMGVESLNEKAVKPCGANFSSAVAKDFLLTAFLLFAKGVFCFMTDVIILIVKVVLITAFALFLGKKTGVFALGRAAAVIVFAALLFLFGAEIYSSFFRSDISLLIVFNSSFGNFTLDLSFFVRIFLLSLLLGLLCSVFGVKPSARIDSVRDLCALALLIAITVLLGIYATVRVGSAIKIPFKFISVFITAALFGPFWGGTVGALADIIAFLISPVGGAFIPQITMVEFFYGFVYGLFFYNLSSWGGFKTMLKIMLCVIFQIVVLNMALTTYLLMPIMQMDFNPLFVMRAPAAVINMALQMVIIALLSKYISTFRKILK